MTINLRYPGQYYDPSTGRYVSSDPVSVGEHAQAFILSLSAARDPASQNAPDAWQAPLESLASSNAGADHGLWLDINPYSYTLNNPARWSDSTGKGLWTTGLVIIAGGVCALSYCEIHAQHVCEAKYPPSGGPENDRKRVLCASKIIRACVDIAQYLIDPMGSAASKAGEEVGKRTCHGCQH